MKSIVESLDEAYLELKDRGLEPNYVQIPRTTMGFLLRELIITELIPVESNGYFKLQLNSGRSINVGYRDLSASGRKIYSKDEYNFYKV